MFTKFETSKPPSFPIYLVQEGFLGHVGCLFQRSGSAAKHPLGGSFNIQETRTLVTQHMPARWYSSIV